MKEYNDNLNKYYDMTKWDYIFGKIEKLSDCKLNGLFMGHLIYNLSRASMIINFTKKELIEFKEKFL